jgi:hypothetical protein
VDTDTGIWSSYAAHRRHKVRHMTASRAAKQVGRTIDIICKVGIGARSARRLRPDVSYLRNDSRLTTSRKD